jgi:ubiquinone/menaquinone biosynthesis C-methylase UbiE
MAEETGRFSLFRPEAIRGIDPARARELAEATLENRGRSADEVTARAAYLDLLGIAPGERVLEVGCGSGVVLRDLARRVAPHGRAVGLDPSPGLLAVARELADQAGLGGLVELREGDVRALPFEDGAFDAILAVTALVHVPEVERAIPELVRTVRPGGRVGVFDRDNDSYIISHPDRALTRRIVAAGAEHTSVNPWIGRQLPSLFNAAGLRDVRVRAFASLEQDPAGFYATNGGLRWADIAVQVGAISDAERRRWLDQLREVQAAGGFVAGLTHLFVWGTRGA